MARNDGHDRTVVRNANLTKSQIINVQHHNEREKEKYVNQDIVLERSNMNVHFKKPTGNYEEMFDELVATGVISTRGLKKDAKVFGELVFDVNSEYFRKHGGYEFAKQFYQEVHQAAVEIVGGEEYILSSEMHADEINRALSEEHKEDVYHYHLHVVYIPVVKKEILWTKRCKDKSLVGTVKETIMQVSSSKKWESKPVLDEEGKPLLQKNGKPVLKKSYSILQDAYFNHMREAGYTDLERGEYRSTEEHLTITQYKVEKEKERLEELQKEEQELETSIDRYRNEAEDAMDKVQQAEEKLEELAPIIEDTERLTRHFASSPEEFLPEPGTLESAKNYREKKAIPVFEKMVEVLRSLNHKYWDLKNRFYKLQDDYSYERRRCDSLISRNEILENENEKMKVTINDFQRVKKYFGPEKIAEAIGFQKQKEAESRTQRRKTPVHER